jgi:virginiamycin B lyase
MPHRARNKKTAAQHRAAGVLDPWNRRAVDVVAMLDTKTDKLQEWTVPTKWPLPYQAKADKNGDIWTGGMAADRIVRINSKTGDMVEYPLPASTNIRDLYVDDSTTPVSIWFGNNYSAAIVKLRPLD